ncbi:hypothetical protein OIU76_005795 [Salix suchowensis]|nr:hypothetical protein OIU76_005795 [Salix suchowensis]
MFCLQLTATGTILSLNSANSALNRSKNSSRQVVPSGHTTRSPFCRMADILAASAARSRVKAMAGMGERNLERRLTLYVTHETLRPSAMAMIIGSRAVR